MAPPIPMQVVPRDPREDAIARLRQAPAEHAEAVLALYEILQGMQDHGVLELLRGLAGSSDKVTDIVVDAAKAPPVTRGLRNALAILRTLGEMDPELFDAFALALPTALAQAKKEATNPASLWTILREFRSPDMRRGLVFVNSLLEAWGRDFFRKARPGTKE
jgi:uncharacterized protein YjgD (DUF1641 family)